MPITSDNFDPATNTQTTKVLVTTNLNGQIPLENSSQNLTTITPSASTPNYIIPPAGTATNILSDVRKGVASLPIRGEKRIIPAVVNTSAVQNVFDQGAEASGTVMKRGVEIVDFYSKLAKAPPLTEFIKIRIPHRGINTSTGIVDTSKNAEFSFLINPSTVSVNKQTVDTQAFTRGGWQFGVWGEDVSSISLSGQTAGSYFAIGLTDEFQYYATSYRNLLQLQQVFENNGYWFEGEEYNEGPMAADYLRRRIRMHQDLELWVGNFIWYGMFESMSITQDAQNPFRLEFEMTFIAWKERYRPSAGYWDGNHNDIQRGHSYPAVIGSNGKTANDATVAQTTAMSTDARLTALQTNPNVSNAPAAYAANAEDILLNGVDPQAFTNYGPTENLLMNPATLPIWNT